MILSSAGVMIYTLEILSNVGGNPLWLPCKGNGKPSCFPSLHSPDDHENVTISPRPASAPPAIGVLRTSAM